MNELESPPNGSFPDNFEDAANDLEARSARLTKENNPHNLGIDEVLYASSRLVRALGTANHSAKEESRAMFWLTILLGGVAVLQLLIAYGQYRLGEVQIDAAQEQTGLQRAIWEYDKMRDDRLEVQDIHWRREDLEFQGRLPTY